MGNKVIMPFCWNQNFVPWGLSWKKLYKIRFQRDFLKLATNERSDKMFLLTSKFCPQVVVSSWPGVIYMYKIMKKCIKSRLQKRVFFLNRSDKRFKILSPGVVTEAGKKCLLRGCMSFRFTVTRPTLSRTHRLYLPLPPPPAPPPPPSIFQKKKNIYKNRLSDIKSTKFAEAISNFSFLFPFLLMKHNDSQKSPFELKKNIYIYMYIYKSRLTDDPDMLQ